MLPVWHGLGLSAERGLNDGKGRKPLVTSKRGAPMRTVITKIENLLARAAHDGTPEEEARTSAHVAAKLMAEHKVKVISASLGEPSP
jgi:hypothetical protein